MADETEPTHDQDSAATIGHELEAERTTAPMSEFSARDATVGFAVMVVGLVLAFGIPLVAFPL